MTRLKWTSFMIIFFLTFQASLGFAQSSNRAIKRSVATVIFSTLGGGVLGLSTLPFYGEPQEHTGNISLGALLGLIAGVGYLVYDSTASGVKSSDHYSEMQFQNTQFKRALEGSPKALSVVQINFDF